MITVRNLLNTKGDDVWSVKPTSSVFEALELMAEKDIGAVLVMDENQLEGIFSERDYARNIVLKGKVSARTMVAEVMTREVIVVSPEMTIEDCMALMTENRFRHLPVVDEENKKKVVGVISIGDVVNEIIEQQEFDIDQMEKYIAQGKPA